MERPEACSYKLRLFTSSFSLELCGFLLDEVDEAVGGDVVGGHGVAVGQLGLDGLGELLAKLNTAKKCLEPLECVGEHQKPYPH